jgi:hypothetical protein
MRSLPAKMPEKIFVRAAGLFESIGEDREEVERRVVIDCPGQVQDCPRIPG